MTPPMPFDASNESVRKQLETILVSPAFANAERLSRFLRFAVQQVLDGKGNEIKEYLVGIEVFDRPSSYDPRSDPVVRVEARRLRARLTEYYSDAGQNDPVLIEIPKGGYAPLFRQRQPAAAVEAEQGLKIRWKVAALIGGILLCICIAGIWIFLARQAAPTQPSLAVLPFLNLSGTPENEYFTDGLVEELTSALAQIEGLRVVARTSAFQFRGKSPDIRAAGRQLGVDTILEGSVRTTSNRVRITAQLIKVADGFHIWSETYEREPKDIFVIQDEVTEAIAQTLKLQLADARLAAKKRRPPDLGAYDLYLKGQYFKNRVTPENLLRSIQYLEESIRKDSNYAPAYAALADANATIGYRAAAPEHNVITKAKAAATKALELDDRLAEAHAVLAWLRFFNDWDWKESERGMKRALELNPNSVRAHDWHSQILMCAGHLNEAVEEMKKALVLDPLSCKTSASLALVLYCSRRYDEAIVQARQALEMDPHFFLAHHALGVSLAEKQRYPEAGASLQAALREYPSDADTTAHLGVVQSRLGKKDEAQRIIAALENPVNSEQKSYYQMAFLYGALGDKERAFISLDRAYEQHSSDMPILNVDPAFDSLRPDARFRLIQKKMGWAD